MTPSSSLPAFFPGFSASAWHHLFEALAFTAAGQIAWRQSSRQVTVLHDRRRLLVVLAGALLGAALGAKALHALQFSTAFAASGASLGSWLGGKSLVGGLLGAIAGVEIAKRAIGVRAATGDAFVMPLVAGIAIGRIGCFAAGLADGTYGVATSLPWGVDFGDGIARHPTQLYESLFVLAAALLLTRWRAGAARPGDRFRVFVLAYLAFRFLVEFLKPPFGTAAGELEATRYGGGLTAIQFACLLGIALYAHTALRLVRERP